MLTFLGKYRDNAPLVIRLMLGLTLVFAHGLPKVMAPERWEREGQAMSNLGIAFAPVFWGFMAGAT
jgi:putative oxidoreductase